MSQEGVSVGKPLFSLNEGRYPYVSASLLSANSSVLGDDVRALEQAGADWIHFDVMDGVFVSQITWGAKVISDLRPLTDLPFDVHLMVMNPYVLPYIDAGADVITFHPTASKDPLKIIETVKRGGCKAGLAVSPGDAYDQWPREWWMQVDMVTVMTVPPGAAGQAFLPESLKALEILKATYPHLKFSVDGGITQMTAAYTCQADVLVSGSFLFAGYRPLPTHSPSLEGLSGRIAALKQAAERPCV